jgi:hypothetical protein
MLINEENIKRAKELGLRGKSRFILHACENCGKNSWVRLLKNDIPVSRYCRPCGIHLVLLKKNVAENNKDAIIRAYVVENKSANAIAKEYGLTVNPIASHLKKWGIVIHSHKKSEEDKKATRIKWHKDNPTLKRIYTINCNRTLKLDVLSKYSHGNPPKCAICGIDDLDVLCLDHINGGGEAHRRTIPNGGGGLHLYWWIKRENYPLGFQVLCLNCNWKKHLKVLRQD